MEQKDIDIYEILKDMPDGTSLYTPMVGKVELTSVATNKEAGEAIWTENRNGEFSFDKNGRWMEGGEVLLFPSNEMRDWAKFSWKKGDVLANGEGDYCVFKEFAHSSYQTSKAVFVKRNKESIHSDSCLLDTKDWHKASHSCTATYINTIEKELSGKLNMETLEIEKPKKPVFEIGKLYVFNEDDEDGELTIIGKLIDKNESEDTLTFGNQYEIETEKFVTDQAFDLRISVNKELREATENEVELFNKHYDIWKNGKEEKEQPAFKTFDKVLVRNGKRFKWQPAFFVRDRGEEAIYRYKVLLIEKGKVGDFTSCIQFEGHENIAFTDYDIENLPF
ncbi:MAG: hypothetical protein U0K50_03355 [Segatella copri]|nr:hypothetical protein [Segatella copri]